MNNETFQSRLEKLRQELMQLPLEEESLRSKRDELAALIQEMTQNDEDENSKSSFMDTLEAEISAFEKEYPTVSQIMEGIRDMLTSIGI